MEDSHFLNRFSIELSIPQSTYYTDLWNLLQPSLSHDPTQTHTLVPPYPLIRHIMSLGKTIKHKGELKIIYIN